MHTNAEGFGTHRYNLIRDSRRTLASKKAKSGEQKLHGTNFSPPPQTPTPSGILQEQMFALEDSRMGQ